MQDTLPDTAIFLNDVVSLDLTTLIETRLIIQANSGGGKTWAIRRLLEQSHGKVQHIIIVFKVYVYAPLSFFSCSVAKIICHVACSKLHSSVWALEMV